ADVDRQPGPGMRRQILVVGAGRLAQVQAGQRQLDLDLLFGVTALTADYRLDRLDPVIVGRLVFEAQRGAGGALRRLAERGGRRVVGDDRDRPFAERGSALAHGERLAFGQGRLGAEVLLVDGLEIAGVVVDRQPWQAAAAVDLREQR